MKALLLPKAPQIAYLEADVNYTIFHLYSGERIMCSYTLKRFEDMEAYTEFIRINKSYLLNPTFIHQFVQNGNMAYVRLSNGHEIDVPRRKLSWIREKMDGVGCT
jgi:DNA-binding LytR/AlgR family response regulator